MSAAQPLSARHTTLLLWLVPALWSSNYVIARSAAGIVHPHVLALARWSLAAALMLPLVWPRRAALAAEWRRDWPRLVLLGGLGMWICGAFVYQGGLSTSAANIALIYAVTPAAIVLLGAWWLHEPIGWRQFAGVGLALAGLAVVISGGQPTRLLSVQFTTGDLWIVAAAISWTAYSVLLKHWPSALAPLDRLWLVIAGGIVVLVPFTLLEATLLPPLPFGAGAFGLALAAAVIPGVLSYGAYSLLQRSLGAGRTALMLYLAPVYGALLAWLLLGERPGWHHVAGGTLILPSIALATSRPAARAKAEAAARSDAAP